MAKTDMDEPAAKLTARVTHLEMRAQPPHRVPVPLGHRLAVMAARGIPAHFYRYLYEKVGKPHHWLLRRHMDDARLTDEINAETVRIEVIYCDGVPAGFFELDLGALPGKVEIRYFGLVPDFQDRGLAKFFLSNAVFAAWSYQPAVVTIHTNTLDSPRALILYQKIGFQAVGWSQEEVEPWL